MASIELSKLVAHKKFFVPIQSSNLQDEILKQIKLEPHIWQTWIRRPRSGTLRWNYKDEWSRVVLFGEGKPFTESNLKKKRAEFEKDSYKKLRELLARWMGDIPQGIHFVVTDETKDGCVCDVSCQPLLLLKIEQKIETECSETDMQYARMQCEEFLIDVFVGGLKGREIVEKRETPRWELLINDVNCRYITARVYEMLEQAVGEVLIMGWVGTDCLPRLKELKSKGVTVQAVTHKPSEMKSPVPKDIQQGYTNLLKILDKSNISANRELHGRAIIVDNKALVGSMDLNSYSLSGEHREFAIYTEDVNTIREMRAYFKKIFVPLKQNE